MKKEDLDALAGLYEGVYSPVSDEYLSENYLVEAPQNDIGYRVGRGLAGALRDLPAGLAGQVQGKDNAALQRQRQRGQNFMNLLTTGKVDKPASSSKPSNEPYKSRFAGARDAAVAKARQIQGSPVVGSKPAAAKPAATSSSVPGSAKVAPSAPKPFVKQTGDKAKDEATWRAANPTLANKPKTPNPLMKDMPGQNKAELDQLRGNAAIQSISQSPSAKRILSGTAKSATANEIGKASLDRSAAATEAKPPAPKIPSTTNQTGTAFAKTTPTLSSPTKTPAPTLSSKPTTNQTATAFSSPAIVKPTPSTSPIKKPGAVMSSFEWGSKATLKDVASLYSSIYEGKKKDQDQDGDNDFADVRIARMIASGMSKAEAIAAVKNKEYNEEVEIDEATRMRKELGKEGETATRKELAARSKAYERSGSVDKTIAAAERGADRPYIKHKRDESDSDRKKREERQSRTLRGLAASRRGSVRDKPRAGMSGYAAKVEGGDKDLQSARQRAMSAGTLTPKEKKQLGEVYEIVASYLLENNFAETLNDANVIIENMSEVWLSQILESAE